MIWALLVIIFPQPLSVSVLLAVPAFLLLILNGGWLAVLSGHHRHAVPGHPADHRQPHAAAVLHDADRVVLRAAQEQPAVRPYVELNPVMHFVEIVRQPLLGQPIVWRHWAVVGVITVVGLRRRAGLHAQLPLPRRVLGLT